MDGVCLPREPVARDVEDRLLLAEEVVDEAFEHAPHRRVVPEEVVKPMFARRLIDQKIVLDELAYVHQEPIEGIVAVPLDAALRGVGDDVDLDQALKRERSLFYVAATRAKHEVIVTYHGEPSPWLPDEDALDSE